MNILGKQLQKMLSLNPPAVTKNARSRLSAQIVLGSAWGSGQPNVESSTIWQATCVVAVGEERRSMVSQMSV
jgi:hypothetical protein